MKLKKTCKNCVYAIKIVVNNDLLCLRKGAVSPAYSCGRHKMISFAEPEIYKKNNCAECAHYLLKTGVSVNDMHSGVCRLFSVRYFDGRKRNACSKFEHRQELSVG